MLNKGWELWAAATAILIITVLYVWVSALLGGIPAAGDLIGHSMGVAGFALMLMTETLYSLRKRSRSARWGKMAYWLRFHIFTGLVGPYLVLLHTAWEFNGLAGAVLVLTIIVVASGFFGRYIYTAIPRTADGVEIQARELEEQIQAIQAEIENLAVNQLIEGQSAYAAQAAEPGQILRGLDDRRDLRRVQRGLTRQQRALQNQQRALQNQVRSLASARRTFAAWHAVHIPIGVALFTAATVHTVAAVYYATLIH